MIFDGTYIDEETEKKLNVELGKSFGLIERFRLGRVGSHRMMIENASTGFASILSKATGIVYGNIELRPKGILVHINVKNTRYSWAVPFFRMTVYQSNYYSIHANGEFISFRKDVNFSRNKAFLRSMLEQRNAALPSDDIFA